MSSGQRTVLIYALVSAGAALLLVFYLWITRRAAPGAGQEKKKWVTQACLAGLGWLLLAGPPYWLVDLSVNLGFPNSRVLISFLPGASLLLAGLVGLLPRRLPLVVLTVFVGLAAGFQFFTGNIFRRDWDIQKQLFWQMSWRMPAIEPGTVLLINDLPVHYSTDNSLTAPLNWMYAPGSIQGDMPYLLYYPTLRLGGGLPALEPGIALTEDYLALSFSGSTSQAIALSFNPPACLRVLNPKIDAGNLTQPEIMRVAAGLSDESLIKAAEEGMGALPPAAVFGDEPVHGWCYYFEKAELARQQGDWQQVAALGEQAFALGD